MLEAVRERETVAQEIQTAVRHSAVYGLGGVLAKALGFLMLPFYTHYLNPTDYGILEILDLTMSLFGMFLNMGMTAALLRCYHGAASSEEKKTAVSTAFLFVTLTGIVTFLLMLGFVRNLSLQIFGPNVPAKYLLISCTSFVLSYVANIPRTYLRAMEASGTFVAVEAGSLVLMLGLNIYFIAVLHIGLVGILVSFLISAALQMLLLSGWMLREVGIRFSRALLRQMVGFGLPLIFSNLALFTLNFSDRFFLQHLRSLEVVGIYAVGYKFAFMLNYLLVQPFNAMWQARMYIIHGQPDHRKIFSQMFVLYSLLLTYGGFALSIFSPEIVRVMVSPKFSSSQDVIPIVALAYIFYGISYYVQLGMFLMNRTSLVGILSAAAAVLNLGLNYVLILHFGMLGAAWATLLSFAAIAVASYWASQRVFPLSLGVGRVAAAMGLGAILYFVCRWWTPGSLVLALLLKSVLLAAYPVILWKMGILSPSEIGTLVSTRDKTLQKLFRLVGLVPGRAASL